MGDPAAIYQIPNLTTLNPVNEKARVTCHLGRKALPVHLIYVCVSIYLSTLGSGENCFPAIAHPCKVEIVQGNKMSKVRTDSGREWV